MTGPPVRLVELRLPTRSAPERHPLPNLTQVSHASQEWAGRCPDGTARVVGRSGPWPDGSWEYEVMACRDFARPPGPDNPMDRKTWWPGRAIRLHSRQRAGWDRELVQEVAGEAAREEARGPAPEGRAAGAGPAAGAPGGPVVGEGVR